MANAKRLPALGVAVGKNAPQLKPRALYLCPGDPGPAQPWAQIDGQRQASA